MALTKKIFLTGATGFVGENLLPKLLEKNFKVVLLVRNMEMEDESIHLPNANLTIYQGDFEDKILLEKATQECQTIIHLAAVIKSNNEDDYQRVNVLGTKTLLEISKANKITKFIYLSTDKAIENAQDNYGRTKYEAELLVRESGLDYTVLKCPTIYGREDKVLTKLIKLIKISPLIFIFGSGKYKLQPVYVEDVSRALAESINNPKAVNKVYYLAAPKFIKFVEFIDFVAKKFDKKITKIFLPEWLLNFMPGALGQQFKHLIKGNTFDISAFVKDFNFVPKTVEEGITLTVKKYE